SGKRDRRLSVLSRSIRIDQSAKRPLSVPLVRRPARAAGASSGPGRRSLCIVATYATGTQLWLQSDAPYESGCEPGRRMLLIGLSRVASTRNLVRLVASAWLLV